MNSGWDGFPGAAKLLKLLATTLGPTRDAGVMCKDIGLGRTIEAVILRKKS